MFAHLAVEGGQMLAVVIGLQTVAHRLVEQHARIARPQHDRHFAGRRGHGV